MGETIEEEDRLGEGVHKYLAKYTLKDFKSMNFDKARQIMTSTRSAELIRTPQ